LIERSESIRLGAPPPYADYLSELTWPQALDVCDSFIGGVRAWDDEQLASGAAGVLHYVTWLSREVRGLIEQLQERGVDFDS
jgi:hypothetical protein